MRKINVFLYQIPLLFCLFGSICYADWKPVEKHTIFKGNLQNQCKISKFQTNIYLLKNSDKLLTFYTSVNNGQSFDAGKIIAIGEGEFEIDVDPNGIIHIFYIVPILNGAFIHYQNSKDHGKTFSDPLMLTRNLDQSSDISCFMQGNNTVYLVFSSMIEGKSEIFYVKSNNSGDSFSPPIRVTFNDIREEYLHIAADDQFTFIAYQDLIQDKNIYLIESNDNSFSAPVRINRNDRKCANAFDMKISNDGRLYIAYVSLDHDLNGDIFVAQKINNEPLFQYTEVSDARDSAQEFPLIHISGNDIYVAWNDQRNNNYDIYIARSVNHAAIFENYLNVSNHQNDQVLRDMIVDIDGVLIAASEINDLTASTDIYVTQHMEPQQTHYTCKPVQGIYTSYDNAVIWAKIHDLQDGSPGVVQFRMAKQDSPLSGGIAQVRMNSIFGDVWHEWFYEPGLYTTSPAFNLPLTFTSGVIDFYITVKNYESVIHSGKIQIFAEKEDSMPGFQWEYPLANSVISQAFLLKGTIYDEDMIQKITLAVSSKNFGSHKNIPLYQVDTPIKTTVYIEQIIDLKQHDISPGDLVLGIWSIDGDGNTGYQNCGCPLTSRDIYVTGTSELQILSISSDRLISKKAHDIQIQGLGFTEDINITINHSSFSEPMNITSFSLIDDKTINCNISSLNVTGSYSMTINNATDSHTRIDFFTVIDAPKKMKAIIVAASQTVPYSNDYLWNATQLCATYAYQSLMEKGLSHEDIIYLSPESKSIIDYNANLSELKRAILEQVHDVERVLIYMVGHGGQQSFRINNNEALTALMLDKWLDELQTKGQTKEVILIYDACESGSFVSLLQPPESKKRYIITSSSEKENAYYLYQGGLSFSFQFWAYVRFGADLDEAFFFGRNMMEVFQTSYLDSNGNGIPNEKTDKELAGHIIIGNDKVIAHYFPKINNISEPQILYEQTKANIWVNGIIVANDPDKANVFAVIKPPDQTVTEYGKDDTFPIIQLRDEDKDLTYEGAYDNFIFSGEYIVSVYLIDSRGNYSEPIITTIHKELAYSGDMFENDNDFIKASHIDSPQTHDFHSTDDEDWVYIYGIENEKYMIDITSPSPVSITVFSSDGKTVLSDNRGVSQHVQWICPQNNVFFIQMRPTDSSIVGQESQYQITVHRAQAMDAYEVDDTIDQAKLILINDIFPQLHNFHQFGDEDWIKFYGIEGKEYSISISSPGTRCDTVLQLYSTDGFTQIQSKDDGQYAEGESLEWTCERSGIYYIKIFAYRPDIFGEDTEYKVQIYYPVGLPKGTLDGLICDQSEAPLENAKIIAIDSDDTENTYSAITTKAGIFSMKLDPSLYSVQISKAGYQGIEIPAQIKSIQITVIKESLEKIYIPGDIDNNGLLEMADVRLGFLIFVGFINPDPRQIEALDLCDDDSITICDVKAVFRIVFGLK